MDSGRHGDTKYSAPETPRHVNQFGASRGRLLRGDDDVGVEMWIICGTACPEDLKARGLSLRRAGPQLTRDTEFWDLHKHLQEDDTGDESADMCPPGYTTRLALVASSA